MEEQENLNVGIGTKEIPKLKPAKVKIVNVEIVKIEKAKSDKAVFEVKHPDKEETIKISEIEYRKSKKAIGVSGTWYNIDEDGLILKGSALAIFMEKVGANSLKECIGKEPETAMDDSGYLCFKAY